MTGDFTSSIEIQIEQIPDLTRHFKTLPNALLRGEAQPELGLDYRGLTLRGRCLLAALASMQDGFRCSRSRIAALAPELRRDGLDTVLRELRDRGFLAQKRVNNPDTGTFVWLWRVSLRGGLSAGQTMDGKSGDGPDLQEQPDRPTGRNRDEGDDTIPGSSVYGSSVDGSAVYGSSGANKKNQDLKEEEPPPPTPPPAVPALEPPNAGGGGGDDSREGKPPTPVEALAAELHAQRPRFAAGSIRRALAAELAAGRPWPLVEAAARRCLMDPRTQSPARLATAGPWWDAPAVPAAAADPPVPAPAWCGACEERTRRITVVGENGRDRVDPCPACSPHARNLRIAS